MDAQSSVALLVYMACCLSFFAMAAMIYGSIGATVSSAYSHYLNSYNTARNSLDSMESMIR